MHINTANSYIPQPTNKCSFKGILCIILAPAKLEKQRTLNLNGKIQAARAGVASGFEILSPILP